jgi:hypothetical protein
MTREMAARRAFISPDEQDDDDEEDDEDDDEEQEEDEEENIPSYRHEKYQFNGKRLDAARYEPFEKLLTRTPLSSAPTTSGDNLNLAQPRISGDSSPDIPTAKGRSTSPFIGQPKPGGISQLLSSINSRENEPMTSGLKPVQQREKPTANGSILDSLQKAVSQTTHQL